MLSIIERGSFMIANIDNLSFPLLILSQLLLHNYNFVAEVNYPIPNNYM